MERTAEYTALTRIKWKGRIHEPGDAIDLPDDVAGPLRETRKIGPAGVPHDIAEKIAQAGSAAFDRPIGDGEEAPAANARDDASSGGEQTGQDKPASDKPASDKPASDKPKAPAKQAAR